MLTPNNKPLICHVHTCKVKEFIFLYAIKRPFKDSSCGITFANKSK